MVGALGAVRQDPPEPKGLRLWIRPGPGPSTGFPLAPGLHVPGTGVLVQGLAFLPVINRSRYVPVLAWLPIHQY